MKKIIKSTGRMVLLLAVVLFFFWIVLTRPTITKTIKPNTSRVLVDDEALYRHVKVLSVDYLPRDFEHTDNLNAAASYIRDQFQQMGLEVSEQKYSVDNVEYKNIVTILGPKNGPKIVIGAHYDVAGPYPGADDNASGVAGLIELGRLLSKEKLEKNITLVAYTLEEPPYYATNAMGSYIHAKSEREKGNDIELMISLEMIGYFSEEENSQTFPLRMLNLFYPNKGNFIGVVDKVFSNWARDVKVGMSENMSIPVFSINAPALIPGIDFSDHRSYWAHDYNAVMVTDTSFYRNVAYHTTEDTLDRLDYKKMSEVVRGVFGYVIGMSKK